MLSEKKRETGQVSHLIDVLSCLDENRWDFFLDFYYIISVISESSKTYVKDLKITTTVFTFNFKPLVQTSKKFFPVISVRDFCKKSDTIKCNRPYFGKVGVQIQ